MNSKGTTPDSLRVVRLSDVENPTAYVAAKLKVSAKEAGRLVAASGYLGDAKKLLDRIVAGELERSTRKASAEWRGRLAADLLAEEDDGDELFDALGGATAS